MRGNSLAMRALLAVVAAVVALGVAPSGAFAAKLVQLTVVNKSSLTLRVTLCGPIGTVCDKNFTQFYDYPLAPGKTAYRTGDYVSGSVYRPGPTSRYAFNFTAKNPTVGKPFIQLNDFGARREFSLSEGQTVGCLGPNNPPGCGTLDADGLKVVLYRDADTDRAKVMSITIVHAPAP